QQEPRPSGGETELTSNSPQPKMSADVARGHGDDGGDDNRPPSYQIPTGCGGCLGNRGKGTRKPNLGGRRAGRLHTRQETRNLGLKAITDKNGPVPIRFEFGDRETLMPLGEHAAHWANYLGELVRELSLHYPSWRQMPPERKAGVVAKIGTQFDLRPHMESDRWPQIYAGIQQHLQKIYNGKKAALKERHWVPNEDGTYDVERIRRGRPSHISEVDWDAQIAFWNDPKNLARAAQNKQNRAKSKMLLIPGPKSSGKDIDVYLRPLIDDLNDLWTKPGVETIDVTIGLKRSLEFNGETEDGDPPREFSRDAIMTQLARLPTRVKDVMHIEKNVLESILNTLLMNDKSKDTAKARQDLKRLGIQSGLWLGQNKNEKCSKPQAAYSFTPEDRKMFCQFIKRIKLPDGFGSNFKHKVTDNDTNITGLNSHDYHIMMQCLLPYGLQKYLPLDVSKPLIELCLFFKQIYSQTLMVDGMLKAQSKVIDILCNLEMDIILLAFLDHYDLLG
ncbi:hypothetical protein Tco_0712121, partial [Tanacetum coccineum]